MADPSSTEQALAACTNRFQQQANATWKGREKEALIALTRALDCTAVSAYRGDIDAPRQTGQAPDLYRQMLLLGCASAMRPFLLAVKGQGGGVPWGPSHPEASHFAYSYLKACGTLAFLRRLATLERYGLATTQEVSPRHHQVNVLPGPAEKALAYSLRFMRPGTEPSPVPSRRWDSRHSRMRKYVDSPDGWFIKYDNDWEIVAAYREQARRHGMGQLEAEALPDDIPIGDRTFGEWKDACDQAVGRILAHMDFSALLCKKSPSISMENVLTIFARRDDIEAVWMEAGLPRCQVSPTMKALTLESDGLEDWEHAFEVPPPFYIDLGRDFVLLPCFGALVNPYFALFRHLRQEYRRDWDRGVDRREAIFRTDLGEILPPSRFTIPARGFGLRRMDGSLITDVDALVIDRESGDLALVQLKWHDVFGLSLRERESRRRNINKANEWIDRVSSWIEGRSSEQVLRALGLPFQGSTRPPVLYVLARYAARFTGNDVQDPRANWIGWPEMQMAARYGSGDASPLLWIPSWVLDYQGQFEDTEIKSMEFQYPGLKVSLKLPFSRIT